MGYDGSLTFDTSMDASGFEKGAGKIGDIFGGLGVFKLFEKGMSLVTSSFDSAIDRYDTLQKFPKVLEQMGYSAKDAGAASSKLSAGIQGLPTTLNDVVSTAQRLTVLTGNLETATDTTLALNNAFLASNSSAADAARGSEQYIQMLSKGTVDMQSWRTLQETMAYALNKTAEAFGYAGASAQNDLYSALQDGTITFDQFNSKLIELNNGVGGFAELAKTATGGIKTGFTNATTAIVRGSEAIVAATDEAVDIGPEPEPVRERPGVDAAVDFAVPVGQVVVLPRDLLELLGRALEHARVDAPLAEVFEHPSCGGPRLGLLVLPPPAMGEERTARPGPVWVLMREQLGPEPLGRHA